jgi:hypothetical protein
VTSEPSEPGDDVLAQYVQARLARIGAAFAERDAVEETLARNRDLWSRLYEIDREFDPACRFTQPS